MFLAESTEEVSDLCDILQYQNLLMFIVIVHTTRTYSEKRQAQTHQKKTQRTGGYASQARCST